MNSGCECALWCDILLKLSVQVNLARNFGLLYFVSAKERNHVSVKSYARDA